MFNDWVTLFQYYRKRVPKRILRVEPALTDFRQFYDTEIELKERFGPEIEIRHLKLEKTWHENRRPYYNVFPSIIPMLTRLKLDIQATTIKAPMLALLVRLPDKDNPLSFDDNAGSHRIRSILFGSFDASSNEQGLEMWMDIGEQGEGGRPAYTLRFFYCTSKHTIEEAIHLRHDDPSVLVGIQIPSDVQLQAIKLVCTLCLLDKDPDLIEPDVLAEDQAKFDETKDQKYVDKAHRRNKVGWNIGRQIEKVPHYRRPHLALFWTGKGRTVPKIGPRKGAIVKRSVVAEIPTGYHDDEATTGP